MSKSRVVDPQERAVKVVELLRVSVHPERKMEHIARDCQISRTSAYTFAM